MSERDLDHFRNNLRALILSRGTIADTCRALDINRQQMAKYLSGECFPTVPLLVRICTHFDVSVDMVHRPLIEVMTRDDDHLLHLLRGFSRGPFAARPEDKKVKHPFEDGIYTMWQPSVWGSKMVARQLTQIKTTGMFQTLRHLSPMVDARGRRIRSKNYSLTLSIGDDAQFVVLSFFRRRGVNSWAVSQFRESGFAKPPYFVGITVGSASFENVNMVGAARVVIEQMDMTQHRLMTLARMSGMVAAEDVPAKVLHHLGFEKSEFPHIISPF